MSQQDQAISARVSTLRSSFLAGIQHGGPLSTHSAPAAAEAPGLIDAPSKTVISTLNQVSLYLSTKVSHMYALNI